MTIEHHVDQHGIVTITLHRPEKLNALNQAVLDGLAALLTEVQMSAAMKGLIITGSGKAFCAGADIHRLAACDAASGYQFAQQGQRVFHMIAMLEKPCIAAVNGLALGGGCELAIAAHLRIASEQAQFGQPEVKLGVIPGYGGTQRLARLIGKGRALDVCLTGRFIDAPTALAWGLVSELTAPDALLPRAHAIMQGILSNAPLALAGVIAAIEHGYDLSLQEALHLEAVHFAKTCASADKNAGVDAFLNKRTPHFCGN